MNEAVKLVSLPKIFDARGNLSFIESENHIPFSIQRIFLIYDVPGGQQRGGHAYREQQEFVVCLSGSFDVVIHDGAKETLFSLNRSYYGLYLPQLIWRRMENFSTNSVAMVCSSTLFNAADYIRDFSSFVNLKK
jgi:hypothetical protein